MWDTTQLKQDFDLSVLLQSGIWRRWLLGGGRRETTGWSGAKNSLVSAGTVRVQFRGRAGASQLDVKERLTSSWVRKESV